jgi:hypothetical protein
MKLAIAAAMFLAVLSLTPVRLGAQTSSNPAEKDFVSGGRVEITLESGAYEVRASSDNRIRVRWNEASGKGVRLKLTTNGKSADLRVENTPHHNFHATIEVPALTALRVRLTDGKARANTGCMST